MKILHIAATLGPKNGGAAVACVELCSALAARGHSVEIFTTDIDMPPSWVATAGIPYMHNNVKVHFFSTTGTDYYWISIPLARALWRRVREFDVIHIHSLYRFHLPVTAWICKKFGRPYVVKPHGSLDPFLFRYRRWRKLPHEWLFDRPAYANAAAIHYVALEERKLAETTKLITGLATLGVVVPSAVIVPEGTTIGLSDDAATASAREHFLTKYPTLVDKKVVLFLGRLNFKKGIDILVKAFKLVSDEIPNAHLLFVGPDSDGYARQIERWLTESGVAQKTTFTGMLHGQEKTTAFRCASVFALPSYTENFGIAIIEAMTFGCPVVISNKVNIWQEIHDANAGLVTDCDVEQTAAALLRVLTDSTLARTLSDNGFRLATEKFTWPAAAKAMELEYEKILARLTTGATAAMVNHG